MIKFVTFASEIRLRALLCSSAAVLLTACGGGDVGEADTMPSAQQAVRTASSVVSDEAATAPAQSDARAVVQQESSAAAEVQADDAQKASLAPADFGIAGYGSEAGLSGSAGVADAGTGGEAYSMANAAGAAEATLGMDAAPAATVGGARGSSSVVPATSYKYYVAPNGSDSAAGTSASTPFKTLARAAQAATRGSTTVFVAPGTYPGGFKTTASGSASARIYWVSTTKWGAKIVPPASSKNDTAWDNRGSYVSIIGFEINGTAYQSGTKWRAGIYNGGSYDMISNNRVHHIATNLACTSAGGSAIGVDSYYRGVKSDVIGNLVHDIGPAGCTYVQGIYVSTSGTVKNNVVYRVAAAAIHLWHDATNVIITNNTVVASHTGIIIGGGDFYHTSGPNNNTAVYSNIVYDNKYGISEQGRTGTNNTYRNNLVYQNTYNWTLKNGLSHTGTVSSAPYFTSYTRSGTPNLKPTLSSPAVGRGTPVHAHATDFDGRPRNTTTGFDIGAYQH